MYNKHESPGGSKVQIDYFSVKITTNKVIDPGVSWKWFHLLSLHAKYM